MARGKIFKNINFTYNESDIREGQLVEFEGIRKQLKKYFTKCRRKAPCFSYGDIRRQLSC